jgi:hypothetical protein
MEESNVNNLNGVPNFGHGMPEDGVVAAGVTDVPQVAASEEEDKGIEVEDDEEVEETIADVPAEEE